VRGIEIMLAQNDNDNGAFKVNLRISIWNQSKFSFHFFFNDLQSERRTEMLKYCSECGIDLLSLKLIKRMTNIIYKYLKQQQLIKQHMLLLFNYETVIAGDQVRLYW
jgi:hypothetical protein